MVLLNVYNDKFITRHKQIRSESSPSNYILKKRTKTTIIIQSISKQTTKPISNQYSHATIRYLSKLIPQTRPSPNSKHNSKSTQDYRESGGKIEILFMVKSNYLKQSFVFMAHKIIALFILKWNLWDSTIWTYRLRCMQMIQRWTLVELQSTCRHQLKWIVVQINHIYSYWKVN